jgi:hypothetical protein
MRQYILSVSRDAIEDRSSVLDFHPAIFKAGLVSRPEHFMRLVKM